MSRHKLIHFSEKPLTEVRSVAQGKSNSGPYKPCGLWVSVEGGKSHGWFAWCQSERYGLQGFVHQTEIVLRGDARVVWIKTARELDAFTDEYERRDDPDYPRYAREPDWARVADRFQAIIIAPYLWSRRMHKRTRWYYTWDCASGCIWDSAAVASLASLPTPSGEDRDG